MASAIAHSHLAAGTAALGEAARQALVAQGVAWTDLRSTVFKALSDAASPVSAYDVADRVSMNLGRRIAANSVYRILDLFVSHNLAKRIESRNAYIANTHPACAHDCIFLVCETCGIIDHLDDDKLAMALRSRATSSGFRPNRTVLELLGHCSVCQA